MLLESVAKRLAEVQEQLARIEWRLNVKIKADHLRLALEKIEDLSGYELDIAPQIARQALRDEHD